MANKSIAKVWKLCLKKKRDEDIKKNGKPYLVQGAGMAKSDLQTQNQIFTNNNTQKNE